MKKLSILIVIFVYVHFSFTQTFKLLSKTNLETYFEHSFQEKEFKFTSINGTIFIDFNKSFKITSKEFGNPELPMFSESVLLPNTIETPSLSIEHDGFTEIHNVQIAPSKGSLKRNVNPNDLPYTFASTYTENTFYPQNIAKLNDPFIFRNTRGATVTFFPYQYNPVTKTLRVYKNIRVRVITNSTDKKNPNTFKPKQNLHNDPFQNFYSRLYIQGTFQEKYTPVDDQGDLLIITPSSLRSVIKPLAQWKIEKGIKTTIATTAETGTTDTQIFSWVENFYNVNPNLAYILIVGDHADVPAHSYGTSGSDILYSDSYYGQLVGGTSDLHPEVFVGRFSGNSAQITTMVNRVKEYEITPASGDWMNRALGIGSDLGDGIGDDGEADWQHERNLRTKLISFGYSNVDELYDGDHSLGGVDATSDPTASNVVTSMNNGLGLLNYTGHGDNDLMYTSNFTSTNMNSAANNGKYPFVVSVACNNGKFTAGTCISENWLRCSNSTGPKGGIAACGSSILMAWAEPMQTQDEIVDILVGTYSNNQKTTIGGLFYNGQISMLEQYNNTSSREVMETWVLFGDPSLMFRYNLTQNMNVSHISSTPQNTSSITVNCDTDGALISITQDSTILGTAVVAGGQVTISFPTLTTNTYLMVTGTKQNYKTSQSSIQVGNGIAQLKEVDADLISIYPNPAKNTLHIKFDNPTSSTIKFFDLSGKLVYQKELTEIGMIHSTINIESFDPGMYVVSIENIQQQIKKKITIE